MRREAESFHTLFFPLIPLPSICYPTAAQPLGRQADTHSEAASVRSEGEGVECVTTAYLCPHLPSHPS
jgi:hypothetical protein